MRKLPDDSRDWTDDDIRWAESWSPRFDARLAEVRANAAIAAADETPDDDEHVPSAALPWLSTPDADEAQRNADASGDEYDRWKLGELKREAAARGLTLSDGADGRTKEPWIELLRADDGDR